MKIRKIFFGVAAIATIGTAQAALLDRGDGLIYDDVLNVTWLKDANYAISNSFGVSGINADGSMNWETAQVWIAGMNSTKHLGYSSWRMPATLISDPACTTGTGGLSGYDMNCIGSELGSLYYESLGRQGPYDQWGILHPGTEKLDTGLFANLAPLSYWTSTEVTGSADLAYRFDFLTGGRDETWKGFSFPRVWALLDGDVSRASQVPEPKVLLLLLIAVGAFGLAHFSGLRAQRRRSELPT